MSWHTPFMYAVGIVTGLALGTLIERYRWNLLIRKGVLPAPGQAGQEGRRHQ